MTVAEYEKKIIELMGKRRRLVEKKRYRAAETVQAQLEKVIDEYRSLLRNANS